MPTLFDDWPQYFRSEMNAHKQDAVLVTLYRLSEGGGCHTVSGRYYIRTEEHVWYKVEKRDFEATLGKSAHEEIDGSDKYKRISRDEWLDAVMDVVPVIPEPDETE